MKATNGATEDIELTDRPLLVCDVDDVVLEFITPFIAFLRAQGHELRPQSFRLQGNIFSLESGAAVDRTAVSGFTDAFFAAQADWQTEAAEASRTLAGLAGEADIVFLTAMPPRHHSVRRKLLDLLDMPYPILATESAKGPEVARLHGGRDLPVAFVDDIFVNLHSVRDHLPDCLLVNLMSDHVLRRFAPHPGEGIEVAGDWAQAAELIRAHFAAG